VSCEVSRQVLVPEWFEFAARAMQVAWQGMHCARSTTPPSTNCGWGMPDGLNPLAHSLMQPTKS